MEILFSTPRSRKLEALSVESDDALYVVPIHRRIRLIPLDVDYLHLGYVLTIFVVNLGVYRSP